jgi:putative transposase
MNEVVGRRHALSLGGHFELAGESFEVDHYVDLETLVARKKHGGERVRLTVADILKAVCSPAPENSEEPESAASSGVQELSESDWAETEKRGTQLQLLIEKARPPKQLSKQVAEALGRDISTIYRWRLKFAKKGLAGLAPHHPSGGRGKPRIDALANDIVNEVIQEQYLTTQKPMVSQVMPTIEARCKRAKVAAPHPNTVRNRIAQIGLRERVGAREGKKGKEKFTPRPGQFPGADYPNAVWQVDHTPLDVCIVDDEYRLNIGRVWLTLVIDVYSRCAVGFYLSLDKPNATAVGMALVHAILPKDGWLAAHAISARWPIWGKPVTVHADNDKTFRCEMVTRAAKAHGIRLEWRAVATPHWGGHIERLLGTVNREIHTLPGTTFSNPQERGEYRPHEQAQLTFSELESYLTQYLCGIYHVRKHDGIGRPPIRRYESGMFGDGTMPGVGLPEPIKHPDRLRLDFLPFKEITVQKDGVTWDVITYYDPVIDRWIRSMDPLNPSKRRKFVCRRDPRDLSSIWFLDPDRDIYFKIPYRKSEHPSLNLWELRAVRASLKERGIEEVDEDIIFQTYDELQAIRSSASQKTQAARKANQKKTVHKQKAKAEQAQVDQTRDRFAPTGSSDESRSAASTVLLADDDDIVPMSVRAR